MGSFCKMNEKTIKIASDFSKFPGGRYRSDGSYSGEAFREDILLPAISSNEVVQIILDDVKGYGSSFLEEAFGGLVRKVDLTQEDLLKKLKISLTEKKYEINKLEIYKFIDDAYRVK